MCNVSMRFLMNCCGQYFGRYNAVLLLIFIKTPVAALDIFWDNVFCSHVEYMHLNVSPLDQKSVTFRAGIKKLLFGVCQKEGGGGLAESKISL